MAQCKFFAQGSCREGDVCKFIHDRAANAPRSIPTSRANVPCKNFSQGLCPYGALCFFAHEESKESPGIPDDAAVKLPCKFFPQGLCKFGATCKFVHEEVVASAPVPMDSRFVVPCKYLHRPGGCKDSACLYLHAMDDSKIDMSTLQDIGDNEDKDQEHNDNLSRNLLGAAVSFNTFGSVNRISLPADFSCALVTGLAPGSTPTALLETLCSLGFDLNVECIRILGHPVSSETKAMVKVEDPLFAKRLKIRLEQEESCLRATPMPIDNNGTNCRKIYMSWHKATRTTWVNFGNGDIASRVARKFNDGRYKCLGQRISASTARESPSRGGGGRFSHNPLAWTIVLTDVPSNATTEDIKRAILFPSDKPRKVVLAAANDRAPDAEVSVEVRSQMEKHGPLESFYFAPKAEGKRVKATAWFHDEADARSACSLNNTPLDSLGGGKLTVTLVQSVKVKISRAIYVAMKDRLDDARKTWNDQHLSFRVYHDTSYPYSTLKVEGSNAKDLAKAHKTLEEILNGIVLKDGTSIIWDTSLNGNGRAYTKLQAIAKELDAVVIRDKVLRQLRFCGPPEKFQQVVRAITGMLRDESSSTYEISLSPKQLSWTIQGGFRSIEHTLGKNVAIFNVVSRKIIINGAQEQYETALAIMDGRHATAAVPVLNGKSKLGEECPICLCEADRPIITSCNHTYCLECFEECCRTAASTSKDEFQIECQGDEGKCPRVFTLREAKDYVSSAVFEIILKSSFEEYIRRNPQAFQYCPTPDCGYVYRCTQTSSSRPSIHTCPNCLEQLCTSCHTGHGGYTCAEYKDIASGGRDALEKLKRELNIKDCPKCTTAMEKTEGCNHMTCAGCKAHICWVCMAVFNDDRLCYKHMNNVHGGIGLGLDRFRY